MKRIRKIFLAVWIPIMIFVCSASAGNVGKERQVYGEFYEVVVIGWSEFLYSIILCGIVTIFFYWLVGVEKANGKRTHGKAYS